MMRASTLFPFSFFLLPFLSLAADIETTDWGVFWQRGSFTNAIPATRTPGSDRCETLRIYSPHVYAFLDGYDTRAFCGAGLDLPATPPNTNATARFSHFGRYLERNAHLGRMSCEPTNLTGAVIWGSSAMEGIITNVAPAQTDFSWTRNPTALCYSYGHGTGWMPCFYSITSDADGFSNPVGFAYDGGIAARGWYSVILEEPTTPDPEPFSHYVNNAVNWVPLGGRSATPNLTFWSLVETTFSTAASGKTSPAVFSAPSYRLDYRAFGASSQALSLFDRSYLIAGDLVSVTNDFHGSGEVVYSFHSADAVTVRIDGEGHVTKGWSQGDISFEYDDEEGYIHATNTPCAHTAPRAVVSRPSAEADVLGFGPDPVLTELSCEDVLENLCNTVGTYRVVSYKEPGDSMIRVRLLDASGETVGREGRFAHAWFEEGDYEIDSIYGSVSCSYQFHMATDVRVQRSPAAHWYYPSNVTCLADCDQTFLMSYVATTNYAVTAEGSMRDIRFGWSRDDEDWKCEDGYGYAAKRYEGAFPLEYPAHLGFALGTCAAKCVDVVGNDFFSDPHYCGYEWYEANWLIGNIPDDGWDVKIESYPTGGSDPVSFTNEVTLARSSGGHITMDPESVVIGDASLYISGKAVENAYKTAHSVQTNIKGIIQANWDFPQLKRSNP